jgi:hypothetical protein
MPQSNIAARRVGLVGSAPVEAESDFSESNAKYKADAKLIRSTSPLDYKREIRTGDSITIRSAIVEVTDKSKRSFPEPPSCHLW